MKFELEEYHRGVTDDELISDLKRVAAELNRNSITRDDYKDRGKYGVTTHIRRFGSWFSALGKAGLEKTRTPMNLPEEDLFENLEEIWTKLGRQPRYAEIQSPSQNTAWEHTKIASELGVKHWRPLFLTSTVKNTHRQSRQKTVRMSQPLVTKQNAASTGGCAS